MSNDLVKSLLSEIRGELDNLINNPCFELSSGYIMGKLHILLVSGAIEELEYHHLYDELSRVSDEHYKSLRNKRLKKEQTL